MSTPNLTIKVIGIMGTLFGTLFMASRFIGSVRAFLGNGSTLSTIELYLILFGFTILFYQNYKINVMKTKMNKDVNEIKETITSEYKIFVTNQIGRVELMMANTNEEIKEIKAELQTISANIFELANRK